MSASDLFHVARIGSRRGRPLPSIRQVLTILAGITLVAAADPRPATFWTGAVITALGWSLRVWSFGHLRKNEELTTSGPYRHSRNPIYVALTAFYLGLSLALDIVWGFLLVPGVLAIMHYGVVLREEAYLARKFPAEFAAYSARVRRWL